MGHVADVFDETTSRAARPLAIGHVRYSTAGESRLANAQPILIDCAHGQIAHRPQRQPRQCRRAARRARAATGRSSRPTATPRSSCTSTRGRRPAPSRRRVVESVSQVQGAFSLVMMTQGPADRRARSARVPPARARAARRRVRRLLGDVRDGPDRRHLHARRRAGRGGGHQRATGCGRSSRSRRRRSRSASSSTCISRGPTATSSARASTRCARTSAACWRASSRVAADVVVPVPDSGVCAAIGLRRGIRHSAADGAHPQPLRRPHVHRAAAVDPPLRRQGEAESRCRSILDGKRVVLVDDSIVRGTTSRKIVKMVRAAGAKEVHVRISCPPTISPCFYGVDTPRRSELIAATHTLEEIREYLERRQRRLPEPRRAAVRGRCRAQQATALRATPAVPGGVSPRRSRLPAAGAEARQGRASRRAERCTMQRELRCRSTVAVLRVRGRRRARGAFASPARHAGADAPQAVSPRELQAAIDTLGDARLRRRG